MKKVILVIAAIMATMTASAQHEPGKWSIDLNLNLGGSWLSNSQEYVLNGTSLDKQAAPAVGLGVGATYQVNDFLGLSAGVNYAMMGQAWENLKVGKVKYDNNSLELTYVQIPVMAHVYFYKGWAVNAGIQPGFLVNADLTCHIEDKSGSHKVTDDRRIDAMDEMKKFDFTIPLGVSYEFKNHLVLGLQYNLGLTAVNEKNQLSSKDMKNGAILFNIAYKIGL